MSLLAIEDLEAGYGEIIALHGVSLTVEAGEVVTISVRTAPQDHASAHDFGTGQSPLRPHHVLRARYQIRRPA